jgi:drug/metabolite transporter (DMT)-like permease
MNGVGGTSAPPTTTRLVLAFLAAYVIWGSTYLFIRWGVESMPPLVLAGIRCVVAASLMTAWARWQGAPWPDAADLATASPPGC